MSQSLDIYAKSCSILENFIRLLRGKDDYESLTRKLSPKCPINKWTSMVKIINWENGFHDSIRIKIVDVHWDEIYIFETNCTLEYLQNELDANQNTSTSFSSQSASFLTGQRKSTSVRDGTNIAPYIQSEEVFCITTMSSFHPTSHTFESMLVE